MTLARLTIDVNESISKVWSFLIRLEKVARCFDFIQYGDRISKRDSAHWFIRPEKTNEFSSKILKVSIISKTEQNNIKTQSFSESSLSLKVSNEKIAFMITFYLKKLSFIRTEITVIFDNLSEKYLKKFNQTIEPKQFISNLKREIETGEIGYWDFFN